MRTRIKICGITRQEDAVAVVQHGADALGLVFFPDSPRYVRPDKALQIIAGVAPFVTTVGLFVNPSAAEVNNVLQQVPLGMLQFHGSEDNATCNSFGLPFIKSIAMREGVDILSIMEAYPDAAGLLLDAWQPDIHGGGGTPFDWHSIPKGVPKPLILAGGLSPDNIAAAVSTLRPYAVDVSSGVESARGIKSAAKIAAFTEGVRRSDTSDPE